MKFKVSESTQKSSNALPKSISDSSVKDANGPRNKGTNLKTLLKINIENPQSFTIRENVKFRVS